jgi:hypothetical protein
MANSPELRGSETLDLPIAALRALAEVVRAEFADAAFVELRIRLRDSDLNVREMATYLGLLDGVYGRLDAAGYRSYALRSYGQLRIAKVEPGSIDLTFLFNLLTDLDAWRVVMMYLVVKVGPALLRGEVAKNWAEAGKAVAETRHLLSQDRVLRSNVGNLPIGPGSDFPPLTGDKQGRGAERMHEPGNLPQVSAPEPVAVVRPSEAATYEFKMTKSERKQLRAFINSDSRLARLSDRQRHQIRKLVEQLIARERHRLPASARFARENVIAVDLQPRRGSED